MKPTLRVTLIAALSFVMACATAAAQPIAIIPQPAHLEQGEGTLQLRANMTIACDAECEPQAQYLREAIFGATAFNWGNAKKKSSADVVLAIDAKRVTAPEGYELRVDGKRVTITGHDGGGVFYGIQTLLQLLPPAIHSRTLQPNVVWSVPQVVVSDAPNHPWRGMMLDVARYFFDKEFVKHYIDMMAMYKMNKLQFHLIDDSGWRLEIKKYPRLTEVGAWAGKNENRLGGFYSQEDIKEIIDYAAVRNVEIIPEIEFPAHMLSAVVAYPWLSCTGKQHDVPRQHFISRDLLCVGKETSYQFLADVLEETANLFPSNYINIGGDEAVYDRWQECPLCQEVMKREGLTKASDLQGYLTNVVADMMKKRGKTVVGWEEIIQRGKVNQQVVALIWHEVKDSIQATQTGHKAILAPATNLYLDFPESRTPGEIKAATWMPPISLEKCYSMPINDYSPLSTVLGVQGCFWSDQFIHGTILQELPQLNEDRSERYAEYLSFPRLLAVAELGWCSNAVRNWQSFKQRIGSHYARLDNKECNYRVPEPDIVKMTPVGDKVRFELASPIEGAIIRYTTDGSYPHSHSSVYTAPVDVDVKTDFRAITEVNSRHYSLPLYFAPDYSAYEQYGTFVAEWKPQLLNAETGIWRFETTGKMVGNGTYDVTFVYTRGESLNLGKLVQYKRDEKLAEVPMQATVSANSVAVTYRLTQTAFEAGLPFYFEVEAVGNSHGYVFVKKEE
ncbi:MAG: beta-N-acetylhexosaminidase [Muribaculaceae bacterium]